MSIEVRDPVHGTIFLNDGETEVIDSPIFQRLRAIKQLGFADISFPGATHTRFLHSIGVCHLAGVVFDSIFKKQIFSSEKVKERLRQSFRLGALLHDVGHGPLSHTTEDVMPPLKDLDVKIYNSRPKVSNKKFPHYSEIKSDLNIRASHEDYTLKFLTDSQLSDTLKSAFKDLEPYHVACLIDKTIQDKDDFFCDQGIDYRPLLSQLVSSELDVDRMDYLERDSYFTGTNYGKFDSNWLVANLTPYQIENKMHLGLNRRALYTFDDFLISRHHIHLMVYFHHKALIYEEMLNQYLMSDECQFFLPSNINDYILYHDFRLYEHLSNSKNTWAKRIADRNPFKMLIEMHHSQQSSRPQTLVNQLESEGVKAIWASSSARLSKYHSISENDREFKIFVVDHYDRWAKPTPIDQSTEIFQKYEGARIIDRIYVAPENVEKSRKILDIV